MFMERHKPREGRPDRGVHFHMVVYAPRAHRWRRVADELRDNGLNVHFSAPGHYSRGFQYCFMSSSPGGARFCKTNVENVLG